MSSMINNGDKVRDAITGFVGTVTGQFVPLHGNTQWQIEGMSNTGVPIRDLVDDQRLEPYTGKNMEAAASTTQETTGQTNSERSRRSTSRAK
jgi:hypothetical protein